MFEKHMLDKQKLQRPAVPIYVITPVSRPENIEAIRRSLMATLHDFDYEWIALPDGGSYNKPGKSSHYRIKDYCHYGKPILNHGLARVAHKRPGMVMFLDDDTIVPSTLAAAFHQFFDWHYGSGKLAFTVQQVWGSGRTDKMGLRVDVTKDPYRANGLETIDQGCYVIHSDLIGASRFFCEEGADARRFHDADGEFYREVRGRSADKWVDMSIIGSIYNELRTDQ